MILNNNSHYINEYNKNTILQTDFQCSSKFHSGQTLFITKFSEYIKAINFAEHIFCKKNKYKNT